MAIHYRTQGFFLKKSARGEADELFTIYTKDLGKLKIFGKAIKKIVSKLRGGAELFYLSEIEFIQGKNRKTLTDAILIDKFPNIRKDLRRLRIVYRIAEALDYLISDEEKDEEIWQLMNETFEKLNSPQFKINNLQIVYYYFFWNLVSILGYQPDISGCSLQGRKINCDTVKILKVIFKKDWHILSRLKLEASHLESLKNISEWYKIEIYGHKK